MSEQRSSKKQPKSSTETTTKQSGGLSRTSSTSSLAFRSPTIQTKLKVNMPGDAFEKQADAIADSVMTSASSSIASPPTSGSSAGSIQRMETPEDDTIQRMATPEDDTIQRMAMPEDDTIQRMAMPEDDTIQRMAMPEDDTIQRMEAPEDDTIQRMETPEDDTIQRDGEGNPGVSSHATTTIQSPGGGNPLPSHVQERIEPHLDADLGDVRVHNDANAAQAASDLQARAFTYNNHIFLNSNESASDLRLMAHESAHVAQQGGVIRRQPLDEGETQASPNLTVPEPIPAVASTPAPMPTMATAATPASSSMPTMDTPSAQASAQPKSDSGADAEKQQEPAAAEKSEKGDAATGEAEAGGALIAGSTGGADVEILMPEPPTDLSPEAKGRLKGVENRVGGKAKAQGAMPPAGENLKSSRDAVTVPDEETKGQAENAVVTQLQQGEPSPEIEELCKKIKDVITSKRPPDEDSLVDAKPKEMAEASGTQLNSKVEGDANRVKGEYNAMDGDKKGAPARDPKALEPQPGAEQTAAINATQAAPDAVPKENVSLDGDVDASQKRMDEAGMNKPAAQEVKDGPIAEAREAQGELEEKAAKDPAEVMAEQNAAISSAKGNMAALQAKAQEALERSRAEATGSTEKQQSLLVGSEEEKRRKVGAEANRIFTQAQKDVDAQLSPLSKTAMDMWKAGIARHSTTFENSLKEVKSWIDKRHSGVGGFFTSIGDAITGLPAWVTKAYNAAETEFGDNVCKLIREISGAVNVVITNCQTIITNANKAITELFNKLPADMQAWAAEQQAGFQEKLNGLTKKVNSARDDVNKQLKDSASQAVQEVRERIDALRQAAKGLLGRIADAVGAFLDDPVRAIINGLLNILGIPPASFWRLASLIASVISDIADDPLKFANNMMKALKQGFQKFFDNIGKHLLQGLLDWLFSAMGSVGVTIPTDLSLKSIITFFLQLMGISWARIRKLLAKHIGEENVALIEQAWELISTLIEKGPEGIFEMIKEQLNPKAILDMIMDAAIDYVKETLIKQVTVRIIGMLNPAGAIVQAVELIYKLLKWLMENAARIFTLIETVVKGAADLVAGNVGGMAEAVEKALAKILPIVIAFLADLVGLGDLPQKIAAQVKKLQDWVEKMLDRAIGWLVKKAKGLLQKLMKSGDKEPDNRTPEQKQKDLQLGLNAAQDVLKDDTMSPEEVNKKLPAIKRRYRMQELNLIKDSESETEGMYHIAGRVNPPGSTSRVSKLIRMPLASVTFYRRKHHSVSEYERQLRRQEAGINNMYILRWMKNRDAYFARAKATGSGRDPRSGAFQQDFRNRIRATAITQFMRRDMTEAQATQQAEALLARRAALHDPDQVAGGEASEISAMGAGNINSSIGAQWNKHITFIEGQAQQVRHSAWNDAKMNVKLLLELNPKDR